MNLVLAIAILFDEAARERLYRLHLLWPSLHIQARNVIRDILNFC